jgi:hypothetical protein
MKKTKYLLLLAGLTLAARTAPATTVIPPTFDELVAQAELIFQGSVTNVRSQWVGEGGQRHIISDVTFNVEDAVKGTPGQTYTLRMLGGTVDGESMGVSDAPKFKVGDKDILFVENNGKQFVPLVGIMHGRFRVQHDQSGQEVVANNEGEPIKNAAGAVRNGAAAVVEPNLSAADFKAAIKTKLQTATPKQAPQ